jgi:hypothetical protein
MIADLTTKDRDYPFDPVVAALIFRALISRVPAASTEMSPPLPEEDISDLLIACIKRGFFSHLV